MSNENLPLANQVILVTGASGEIGGAIVHSLARLGAKPVQSRNRSSLLVYGH